jgi:hypothetical protein
MQQSVRDIAANQSMTVGVIELPELAIRSNLDGADHQFILELIADLKLPSFIEIRLTSRNVNDFARGQKPPPPVGHGFLTNDGCLAGEAACRGAGNRPRLLSRPAQ